MIRVHNEPTRRNNNCVGTYVLNNIIHCAAGGKNRVVDMNRRDRMPKSSVRTATKGLFLSHFKFSPPPRRSCIATEIDAPPAAPMHKS